MVKAFFETFLVDEVGQDKCRATAFHYVCQILQAQTNVRPPAFRMKIYQFADDVKYMLRCPLLGGINFSIRSEKKMTPILSLFWMAENASVGNFRHHILLHLLYRTEFQTTGNIYQQHHCQFALLLKHLDVRLVEAGVVTFQSMSRMSSPNWYSRTSENAIPLPLKAEWYCPAKILLDSPRVFISIWRTFFKVLLFPLIYFNNLI